MIETNRYKVLGTYQMKSRWQDLGSGQGFNLKWYESWVQIFDKEKKISYGGLIQTEDHPTKILKINTENKDRSVSTRTINKNIKNLIERLNEGEEITLF